MNLLENFSDILHALFFMLTWRDVLEILFFSSIFYFISCWLKKDKQKNLVGIFQLYIFSIVATYLLDLATINMVLFMYTPSIIMIFILIHQRTLQKNFVGLQSPISINSLNNSWTEELVRALLKAINSSKEMVCIIERNDSLSEFLQCPLGVNMPFSLTSFTMLIESTLLIPHTLLWFDKKGTLRGINASISTPLITEGVLTLEHDPSSTTWKHDAQLLTSKLDAIVVSADPVNRKFTVILSGNVLSPLNADTLHSLLKNSLNTHISSPLKKIGDHAYAAAAYRQKSVSRQRST